MSELLGVILFDPHFRFPDGGTKGKYFTILGKAPSDDYIVARTTSNGQRKSWQYGCHNDEPDPNFCIPIGQAIFPLDTWFCLDYLMNLDAYELKDKLKTGFIEQRGTLPHNIIKDLLNCAASAEDTTRQQETVMRDILANLP